jgi:hypothetical protein
LVIVVDLQGEADPQALVSRGKAPRRYRRDVERVDTIMIHQGGARFGLSRRAKARIAAGGCAVTEAARRGLRLPYHVVGVVTPDGRPGVADVWPSSVYTYASNDLNRRSIAVGILGNFPRFDRRWDRHRHSSLEDAAALMLAGGQALEVAAARFTGCAPLVLTHSQVTDDRPRCPGEHIVAHVLAPAVRAGLVRVDPDHAQGGGQAWPEEWRRHL